MPILYTTEIDDILRQSLEEVAKYKSEIVEELIRIYNSVDTKDKIEAETTKCKAEMDTILQLKGPAVGFKHQWEPVECGVCCQK